MFWYHFFIEHALHNAGSLKSTKVCVNRFNSPSSWLVDVSSHACLHCAAERNRVYLYSQSIFFYIHYFWLSATEKETFAIATTIAAAPKPVVVVVIRKESKKRAREGRHGIMFFIEIQRVNLQSSLPFWNMRIPIDMMASFFGNFVCFPTNWTQNPRKPEKLKRNKNMLRSYFLGAFSLYTRTHILWISSTNTFFKKHGTWHTDTSKHCYLFVRTYRK